MGQKDSTPGYGAVATRVVVTVVALWLAGIGTFKVLFATPDQAAGPAVAVAIGGLALGLAGAWRSRRRGQSTILAVATAVALIGGAAAGSTGGFLAVQQDHEKANGSPNRSRSMPRNNGRYESQDHLRRRLGRTPRTRRPPRQVARRRAATMRRSSGSSAPAYPR